MTGALASSTGCPSVHRHWGRRVSAARSGGLQDGLNDLHVAGAAAEVARDGHPHLGRCGVRHAGQQTLGGHEEPRGAVAALDRAVADESFLERVEAIPLAETFTRLDPAAP